MPDKRRHRGMHPDDPKLFGVDVVPVLRRAVADYSMLLTLGYAAASSLKLICDHFSLTQRQRAAVMRCACSDDQVRQRAERRVPASGLRGQTLAIDGYNLLITAETSLSGGYVFRGRDGCWRDIAGLHGTYRKVDETIPALEWLAGRLDGLGVASVIWLLDRPVANSGRLRALMYELAQTDHRPWQIELTDSPDRDLIAADRVIATSDSAILDNARRWTNLTACLLDAPPPGLPAFRASLIDLASPADSAL